MLRRLRGRVLVTVFPAFVGLGRGGNGEGGNGGHQKDSVHGRSNRLNLNRLWQNSLDYNVNERLAPPGARRFNPPRARFSAALSKVHLTRFDSAP
jgi:hypothetical protein